MDCLKIRDKGREGKKTLRMSEERKREGEERSQEQNNRE